MHAGLLTYTHVHIKTQHSALTCKVHSEDEVSFFFFFFLLYTMHLQTYLGVQCRTDVGGVAV